VTQSSWRVDDLELEDEAAPASQPLLASLHFLRGALRRSWRVWVSFAVIGLLLGFTLNIALPAKSQGTVTLLLAHDPGTDPALAMATDVSLLSTRTLAETITRQLGIAMTPEAFLESFTATAVTNDVLLLKISAPDASAAVARARALGNDFLTFRAGQMRSQSDALVNGYNTRIKALQAQVSVLTDRYNTLSNNGASGQAEAGDVLTQRSQVNEEISSLQQTVEDTSLQTTSVVGASHILDPASIVPVSAKRRLALNLASGLIGGTAIGVGLVLFLAITTLRLRRREEVATAVAAPVRFSVGALSGAPTWRERLSRRPSDQQRELEFLVRGLDSTIRHYSGTRTRLVFASIDNVEDAQRAVAALTARLITRGLSVFVVDLSENGELDKVVVQALEREDLNRGEPDPDQPQVVAASDPVVFRPRGVPSLSQGPLGPQVGVISDLPRDDPDRPSWDTADVVLTLAEVDPAVGADHLVSWGSDAVLLVTAGRSSAERLRTTGELIRTAGLRLLFAVLVGADRRDESLGLPDARDGGSASRRRTGAR
jgi:hypothetical protein